MIRRLLDRLEEALLALLLAAMTLVTFTQVVLRYGFNSGFLWAQEATGYLFLWLVLLGLGFVLRRGAHIGVDLAVKQLGEGARRAAGLLAVALALLYTGLLGWGAWVYLGKLYRLGVTGEDIPLPRWLLSGALLLGFFLLGLRLAELAWAIWQRRREGFALADEAKDALKLADPP